MHSQSLASYVVDPVSPDSSKVRSQTSYYATGQPIIETTFTPYTRNEEIIHAASHGAGLLLSIAGLWWMLDLSMEALDQRRVVASSIYGASLIALFLTSTLYHGLHASPHKPLFRLLDHCAIYLLIAGTSTPFLIVAMRTPTAWWLFAAMWALAALGILSKLWHGHNYPRLSLASYILMGWLLVIVTPQLLDVIGVNGIRWLVASGVSYTVGAVFYSMKKMYFHHVIWHVFVLAGAACSFLAVVRHVLPVQ